MDVTGVFWLVYCEAFAVALFLVARAFHKYLVMPRRCTAKAAGTVIGYSRFVMGASGYAPPRVRYEAGGEEYGVRGPLYSSYRTVTRTAPWLSNRMTTPMVGSHKTDQVFRARYDVNGMVGIKAPALEMFPVGTELDVFYDPAKPKLAFVERCPKLRWVFVLALSCALACAVTGVALFSWTHGAYLTNTYYVSPTGETVRIDQDFFSNEKIRKVGEASFVIENYGTAEDEGEILSEGQYEAETAGRTPLGADLLARQNLELSVGEAYEDAGGNVVWYGRSGTSWVRISSAHDLVPRALPWLNLDGQDAARSLR